jgi:hypothetical protein
MAKTKPELIDSICNAIDGTDILFNPEHIVSIEHVGTCFGTQMENRSALLRRHGTGGLPRVVGVRCAVARWASPRVYGGLRLVVLLGWPVRVPGIRLWPYTGRQPEQNIWGVTENIRIVNYSLQKGTHQ